MQNDISPSVPPAAAIVAATTVAAIAIVAAAAITTKLIVPELESRDVVTVTTSRITNKCATAIAN